MSASPLWLQRSSTTIHNFILWAQRLELVFSLILKNLMAQSIETVLVWEVLCRFKPECVCHHQVKSSQRESLAKRLVATKCTPIRNRWRQFPINEVGWGHPFLFSFVCLIVRLFAHEGRKVCIHPSHERDL